MGFISTGKQSNGIPGIIIQNGQGVATGTTRQREMSLKIHLPEGVWSWCFKMLPRRMLDGFCWINTAVSMQDSSDGAGTRNLTVSHAYQSDTDFSSTPRGTSRTYPHYGCFDLSRTTMRTIQGTPRTISQGIYTTFTVAMDPLVAGFRTDPKLTAETLEYFLSMA